jgi:hypothetical protein
VFGGFLTGGSKPVGAAVSIVAAQLQTTGLLLFAPGIVLVVRDLIVRLIGSLTNPRTAGKAIWGQEEPKSLSIVQRIYGNCWDLPHCREFIRRGCPAHQSGASCWRIKQGCYCDENMILKAMSARGAELDMAKNARVTNGVAARLSLSGSEKRARCRSCGIYAEHQRQKYRLISPLVFPSVAIAIWVLSPTIQTMLGQAITVTDKFMKLVSFAPQVSQPTWACQVSGSGAVEWMFIAWLGIMAVSYLLQLVEYFIFKVQI